MSELRLNSIYEQSHSEPAVKRRIRTYDFKRPNKFNKDHIRTLQSVFEHFSRLMSTFLSSMLRTYCEVSLESVQENIFHEFNSSLPEPVILAVIDMRPMDGYTLMEIPAGISYSIIERILGGSGHISDEKSDYTEIELAIIERVVRQMLYIFKEVWSYLLPLEPKLERLETNPKYNQQLSTNETVAVIKLKASVAQTVGYIKICIPHLSIKPYEDLMGSKSRFANGVKETTPPREDILNSLKDSVMEIKAILGETVITTRELTELQVGDVIQLNSKINNSINLTVDNLVKFSGIPGAVNKKIAVRVVAVLEGGTFNE
ncbi:MAG TPA: flagellar motor switch protein FliM [Clostridia bacterium]|nr:flagellar motor switch protein FliM [Clostridia bacterium]